ncbi:MAG: (deoxy)nucleoside triphosphate pyrophosphohydrolase [Syntrophomonadaceae bacterium]
METVKDVVAAILIKDSKFLIAQRGHDDPLAGLWEFPGGKVEVGESPEESLVREMQEEFCIDVEVERFFASSLFTYDKGTIRLLGYFCRWVAGELWPHVHNDYSWVAVSELADYTFAPADRPLVEKLGREFTHFGFNEEAPSL